MPATRLQDNGVDVVVQAGETLEVTATFEDTDGTQLTEAQLSAVNVTLFDRIAKTAINSRNGQNVMDANDGVLATDGTLTLTLDADDNTTASGVTETHVLRFEYTWSGGDGIQEYEFDVEAIVSPS